MFQGINPGLISYNPVMWLGGEKGAYMKNILLLLIFIVTAGTAVAEEYTLPFGIGIVSDAKLAISDTFDSPSGDREESIARFATKMTRQDVIDFYKNALEAAGFEIYSSSDKDNYAMIAAKRDADRVTVYYKNQSDWVEEGESEIFFKAVYNK